MNRINQKLNEDKKLLSIYFTAGYPNLNDTVTIIENLEKSGVDMIEIGLPFSDPLADGPTIQASSTEALKNGMTTEVLFKQLKDVRKTKTITREMCINLEGERALKEIKNSDFVIALDEKGAEYTSIEFSKLIKKKKDSGQTIVFIIGGSLGLSTSIRDRADQIFSMSKMTLTHLMIRPFLLEQIYRGICIMNGKEYHIE